MSRDRVTEMPPEVKEAWLAWQQRHPDRARRLHQFDRTQERADSRWDHRRQPEPIEDRAAPTTTPAVKPRRVAGQLTALARGARSLMSPVDVWIYDDDSFRVVDIRPGSGRRLGPGRAATMPAPSIHGDSLRGDWNRAEMAWAAAILHLDFYAVYRTIKRTAPERDQLARLVDGWPPFDQRPLLHELLARGLQGDDLLHELGQRTQRTPPAVALRPILALASRIGHGAHLLAASMSSLDLDDEERAELPPGAVNVADLPRDQQRWLLDRREQQILVRRVPALPQERGVTTDERQGTALADVLFAGHSLARHFSRLDDPPRRAVDIASPDYLSILYRFGPDRAALAAAGSLIDRALGTVRRLARDARIHNLVQRENTIQGPSFR